MDRGVALLLAVTAMAVRLISRHRFCCPCCHHFIGYVPHTTHVVPVMSYCTISLGNFSIPTTANPHTRTALLDGGPPTPLLYSVNHGAHAPLFQVQVLYFEEAN
jgi:hypothetical protein